MMGCMAPVTTAPLVGRDAELEDLTLRLGIVASGDGRSARPGGILLLAGDAGVGKTRLLTALRDRALDLGWQVVAGHCLDFGDSALPYLPFSEILGRLQVSSPELLASVASHHPALHRLAPGRRMIDEVGEQSGSGSGGAIDKAALFEAVHALFEAAAEQQPLVLVDRGPPLGRPVDPRPDELPVHPAVQPAGGAGRVLPVRRPPPQAPAARQGRRVVPPPGRPPDVARAARGRRGPPARGLPGRRLGRGAHRRRGRHGRRARRGQRVLRRGARRRHRRHPRPWPARRPRRGAAGPARPARRVRPTGRPCRERRRSPGHPRAAGRRRRRRRRRPRREPAHGRRAQHPGRQRPPLRLPARAARRGRLRRPAARRAGPAARQVRRGDRRRPRPRHRRRAGPSRQARPRREDRAQGQRPGRPRGRPGRRSRRGRPTLRAGAAVAGRARRRRRRTGRPRPARGRHRRGTHQQRPPRARRRPAGRAARRPARRRVADLAWRAAGRSGRRPHRVRDRRRPARHLSRGRPTHTRETRPWPAPGCWARTPTCWRCSGGTRRPSRSASTHSRWPTSSSAATWRRRSSRP